MVKVERIVPSLLACAFATVAFSGGMPATAAGGAPTIVLAGAAKYGPAPAGYPRTSKLAVLSGNPAQAGSQYTVRLQLPSGARIAPHTHGDTENVTVISGTLMVGLGTTFAPSKMLPLSAGSYVSIPAGTPHFAMARGATVVQINGVGPASITLAK